jgi:hypothetical protein
MNQFTLLKSHIDAYTRKDGAVVQAHDDKRTKMSHDEWVSGVKSVHGNVDFKKDAKKGVVHAWSGTNHVGNYIFANGGKDSSSHIAKKPEGNSITPPKAVSDLQSRLTGGNEAEDAGWVHSKSGADGKTVVTMRTGGGRHVDTMDAMGDQGWRVHKGKMGFMDGDKHDVMVHQDGHVATFKNNELTIHHANPKFGSETKMVKEAYDKAGGK